MELNPKSVEEIIAEMFDPGHDGDWMYLDYDKAYIRKRGINNVAVFCDSVSNQELAVYSVRVGGYVVGYGLEHSSAMQLAKEIVMRL